MHALTIIHIITGTIALISGFIALFAQKGGRLHRKAGIWFVASMLLMSSLGAIIAHLLPVRVSIIAGWLTFYLVLSSVLTVRTQAERTRSLTAALALFAFSIAAMGYHYGFLAVASPKGRLDGYPSAPFFIFATVALTGAALDVRLLIAKAITGKHRIARHLWRMTFAMYIATSAFFLGQAKLFPEPLRQIPLLAAPVLLVLLMLLYWLVRTLIGRDARRTQTAQRERTNSASVLR
jgi:uncharacterized membrane protein